MNRWNRLHPVTSPSAWLHDEKIRLALQESSKTAQLFLKVVVPIVNPYKSFAARLAKLGLYQPHRLLFETIGLTSFGLIFCFLQKELGLSDFLSRGLFAAFRAI
mmetsp:Transcript_59861/g.142973  ORF Transcript_59861/g.142973 Transcript_59861/m.142973 type:complete len:104 (+) Transcript_59861:621-932(+)